MLSQVFRRPSLPFEHQINQSLRLLLVRFPQLLTVMLSPLLPADLLEEFFAKFLRSQTPTPSQTLPIHVLLAPFQLFPLLHPRLQLLSSTKGCQRRLARKRRPPVHPQIAKSTQQIEQVCRSRRSEIPSNYRQGRKLKALVRATENSPGQASP